MAVMKNLYSNVQDMLLEGKTVREVAAEFDLPVGLVREIQADMAEFSDDFEGNFAL